MRLAILILLALLPPLALPARAEESFIVRVLPSGEDIAIAGPLARGLGAAFRAALEQAPQARLVRLESTGGTLDVGADLFLAIRARGMDTAVQGKCESACTIAFMAGRRRYAAPKAVLGFHAAAAPKGGGLPIADYMARGLYLHGGMAEWFSDRVMATPHETIWRPRLEELRRGGVVTDIGIPQ